MKDLYDLICDVDSINCQLAELSRVLDVLDENLEHCRQPEGRFNEGKARQAVLRVPYMQSLLRAAMWCMDDRLKELETAVDSLLVYDRTQRRPIKKEDTDEELR
jgi:formyltetrahydrofolate synthetase